MAAQTSHQLVAETVLLSQQLQHLTDHKGGDILFPHYKDLRTSRDGLVFPHLSQEEQVPATL